METLLKGLGYSEIKRGKTGGSRRRFVHEAAGMISRHKPHPGNELKAYQVELVLDTLTGGGTDMRNMMEHKGYLGSVQYSAEDHLFYGKIEHVRSLITFEGTDVATLEEVFEEAVDDYLATCRELGTMPDEPFKGTFNVRVGQEHHRRASVYPMTHDKSLNQVVNEALDEYLELSWSDAAASVNSTWSRCSCPA